MTILRKCGASGLSAIFQHLFCILALVTLNGCASRLISAPVIDHSTLNAGKQPAFGPPPPGYYRVQAGDTLYRIALENGQNYRDIATWNDLQDPDQIEVGQLLRIVPPGGSSIANAPVTGSAVEVQPLDGALSARAGAYRSAPAVAAIPADQLNRPASPAKPADAIALMWPAPGPVLSTFSQTKNKGIDIGGSLGAPVVAAADGRVVYAGNGLHGYGNLIIIKHNARYLTAYAHNRTLLVNENQAVKQGRQIAEMGNSDAARVMLHFELRRQGEPVDPLLYLPRKNLSKLDTGLNIGKAEFR